MAIGYGADLLVREGINLGDVAITCASLVQAQEIITTRDEFIHRLGPFERSARMKTSRDVTEDEFLAFLAGHARPWAEEELDKLAEALQLIGLLRSPYVRALPEHITLVRSTGGEEGDGTYTRGSAVVIPGDRLAGTAEELAQLLIHEFFHILSRQSPDLRRALYGLIGFRPCNEIALPGDLAARRITNPDSPRNDHYIRVTLADEALAMVPALYASEAHYDEARGGEHFDYLQVRLMAIHEQGGCWEPLLRDGRPVLAEFDEVSGFYEQIGRNTDYVWQPEEVLASNYTLLVTGRRDVPSPEILEGMASLLAH